LDRSIFDIVQLLENPLESFP